MEELDGGLDGGFAELRCTQLLRCVKEAAYLTI